MAGVPVSLVEVVREGVASALDDVFTALPGKVTAYDPTTNTASVRPMVKRALYSVDEEKRSYETLPEIPNVPVMWPRAGAYVVTLPLQAGDSVLLVFSQSSVAEWRETGQVSEPLDARRHSIGHPFAIPGAFPDNAPMSPDPVDLLARNAGMVIGEHAGNARIEVTPTTIKIGKAATDFVALATPTQAGLSACMASANAAIAAATALIAAVADHVHPVPGGTSGNPTFVHALPSAPSAGTAPGSVAATMAKAK